MAVLKRPMVYALADSLGMELEYEEKTGRLRGKGERTVDVSGLRFKAPMEVVSWCMTDSAYMVMVKLIGNLALFASVKRGEAVDVHLLNLAKMDKAEQWLEKEKPAAVDDVLRRLERAIVKSFTKTGKNSWEAVA